MGIRRWVTALAIALVAATAEAQANRYEQQYGDPIDVGLDDLVETPEAYIDRAVRTSGRLDLARESQGRQYALRSALGREAWLYPAPDIEYDFEQGAMTWLGKEVEVTGVVSRSGQLIPGQRIAINFWNFVGPPEEVKGPIKAADLTLEALVSAPGKHNGKTVRVVGKFRGRNLYGDLPSRSQKSRSDWVIKDDLYAVWVTGKKPKGSGWELDPALKRDTGKWILVVGRVEAVGGITYLRAMQVELTTAPTPTAEAQPPPPPPEKPKVPPMVVFALPLDGEREVAQDTRFQVQFSKDMEETSFLGNVVLRYAGARQPGDRAFDGVRLRYDGGRRALTVDPGDLLRPGRVVELMLLPGIVDTDGLALEPRPGKMASQAVDVLRYRVTASAMMFPGP
jgi:hypothetical protein